MIYTLYKTTNIINNKFYVGVHTTKDLGFGTDTYKDQYIGSGKTVDKALKKYGRDNFLVEVIAYFEDEKSAYLAERFIINQEYLDIMKDIVYNITTGGNKPPKLTRESAIKAQRTRVLNGNGISGDKNPMRRQEVREKAIANHKDFSGKNNPNYGNTPFLGAKWANNGVRNKRIYPGDILPKDYRLGFVSNRE